MKSLTIYERYVLETSDDPDDILLVYFDGTERESHTSPLSVPDHPLDTGRFVQDHTLIRPETISVDLLVTESPLWAVLPADIDKGVSDSDAADYAPQTMSGPSRPLEVLDMLKRMRGRLVTVHSPRYGKLESYQLVSILSRITGAKRNMTFALSLKHVRFANAEEILLPIIPRGGKMEEPKSLKEMLLDHYGLDTGSMGETTILRAIADIGDTDPPAYKAMEDFVANPLVPVR
jgi:hypothetical protein